MRCDFFCYYFEPSAKKNTNLYILEYYLVVDIFYS